jgi:hypothetical protein
MMGETLKPRSDMNLPIKFPSDADVIIEEVARFRALSPENRMMRRSPRAAFLRDYTLEQESRARQALKEFVARYAG